MLAAGKGCSFALPGTSKRGKAASAVSYVIDGTASGEHDSNIDQLEADEVLFIRILVSVRLSSCVIRYHEQLRTGLCLTLARGPPTPTSQTRQILN